MKRVKVVQCHQSEKGWYPIYVCDTQQEADDWISDERKYNERKGLVGLDYRVVPSKYVSR